MEVGEDCSLSQLLDYISFLWGWQKLGHNIIQYMQYAVNEY